jgi:hypothetical protein
VDSNSTRSGLDFLRYCGRMAWRTPVVLVLSIARLDKGIGMLSLTFAGVGIGTWQEYLPWWAPYVAFGVILLYGFLRASYEDLSKLQGVNTGLQNRVTALEKQPRTEAEELKRDCLQLGTKLSQLVEQWLAEYRRVQEREPTTSKIPNTQVEEEIQSAQTEEEKQRVIDKLRLGKALDTNIILNRAQSEYVRDFRDRAVKLFELAEARGLAESRWKTDANMAGKDLWSIQRVAKKLCDIGRQ